MSGLKERAKEYYLQGDFNCAETVVLAVNDEYGLSLAPDSFKLLSSFGGGMGCGKTCGAIAAATSLLGYMSVEDRAHGTEGFGDRIGSFVEGIERELGSTDCLELRPRFFREGERCLATVLKLCEILEEETGH